MGVKLKMDILKNGRKSLYLDIYINQNNFKRKSLKLYLIPENDIRDKERNEQVYHLAKKIRNEYEKKLLENSLGEHDPRETYNYSFFVYFHKIVCQRYESGVCYDSWKGTENYLRDFITGDLKFTQLTEIWLEEFKSFLLKKVSTNTASTYFNKLKRAIHQAHREGLLDKNPVYRVKSPKVEDPVREYLTVEELRLLIDTEYPRYKARDAFLFSCFTGLRWSDVKNLKWKDVKENKEGIFLGYKQEKTKSVELLPINKQALSYLGERKADNIAVFPNLHYSAWENIKLNQWTIKAGITKHITFHSARHTYATLLLNNDVNIYTVSKLLGHKDIKTTQIYAKLVDKSKFEAVAKLPQI